MLVCGTRDVVFVSHRAFESLKRRNSDVEQRQTLTQFEQLGFGSRSMPQATFSPAERSPIVCEFFARVKG
jgi:hypothetical protein